MAKTLNNKIIDIKLLGRNIIRLENYINNRTPIKWGCTICKHSWSRNSYETLNRKKGCRRCAGSKIAKLTNEEMDIRLHGRNIIRLEELQGSDKKIKWQCTICEHAWESKPNSICSGHGCPRCAGTLQLTNTEVDNRLKNKKIRKLENYITSKDSIKVQCLTCNYIWSLRPDSIRGCSECSGYRISNQKIDKRLKDRKIKRLEDIKGIHTPIKWKCLALNCYNIWKATPNSLSSVKSGCPECAKKQIVSKAHQEIQKLNLDFETEIPLNKQRWDFKTTLENVELYIEIDGAFHFLDKKLNDLDSSRKLDQKKNSYVRNSKNKYLLRISQLRLGNSPEAIEQTQKIIKESIEIIKHKPILQVNLRKYMAGKEDYVLFGNSGEQ